MKMNKNPTFCIFIQLFPKVVESVRNPSFVLIDSIGKESTMLGGLTTFRTSWISKNTVSFSKVKQLLHT